MSTSATESRGEPTVGVLIVDDHELYRAVAADVVAAATGFEVVALASCRAETLLCLQSTGTDVDLVLMDIDLGVEDGVALAHEIGAGSNVDVVLVSDEPADELPVEAITCGARGFLNKTQLRPSALKQMRDGVYDWHV